MTEELIHVRCITCNKIIGHKWETYKNLLSEGKTVKEALNTIGLKRPCCRMRMMNPFKVVTRSDKQLADDPDTSMDNSYANLSVASSEETPAAGALSAMTKITSLTIVPEESDDIGLPELLELPDLPSIGESKGIMREYDARWSIKN